MFIALFLYHQYCCFTYKCYSIIVLILSNLMTHILNDGSR